MRSTKERVSEIKEPSLKPGGGCLMLYLLLIYDLKILNSFYQSLSCSTPSARIVGFSKLGPILPPLG